ncbi:pyridoxamine 5'-phosphate oxidase family protein [Arthrobacter agilis]|uniref:pyridoxamine 5'-phosphate oxidase family protein n=1 Tax=Arthrobacter agilis TaxID=37921 RepID=UPI000B35846E|nr:pyridoxamine 5'-phosphate oxidase family protein [Arthrobacter agilis]OUM44457.1 hypothetical protein B8W74_03060 [Arthrobacter agilis]PPB47361.1 pyridoxamine 5'-phosphate oxidase family protein [Arthrobacter agilis]TPV22849.1 pyridoxamine 5'-phosphate oxidase family protein [Arthrobacter agilis]VDR32102.1 Pyridoxamine 5'-phosphate oxidase [Arthrobacter agilis]
MTPPPRQDAYWETPGALHASDPLTPSQCWALATTQSVGRLGFFREGLLDIFPVNFFVLDERVYFRTRADGVIATSHLEHAAFQIDHTDATTQSGWTILVNGPAIRVDDPDTLTILWGKAAEEPWAPGLRDLFFELTAVQVRGRRLRTAR